MGAEGAVNIIGRSIIEAAEDPEAKREELLAQAARCSTSISRPATA